MRIPLAPKIDTLVQDIYDLFEKDVHVDPKEAETFGVSLGRMVIDRLRKRKDNYLRLSNLGKPCLRQLWYSVNCPELGETLSGPTRIKFLIGDITEAVVLFLARLSGHAVTNEQQEVSLHGVKGHIDALIDGELVDVKSASPYSFSKFKEGLKAENDAFGYLTQLGAYARSLGMGTAHFLSVNKVLGHLHLDTHDLPDTDYEQRINEVRGVLDRNEPPPRGFEDEPDGGSGNRKLGVACSYCPHKSVCWPGLQTYNYAGQPRFLTVVKREPRVEKMS